MIVVVVVVVIVVLVLVVIVVVIVVIVILVVVSAVVPVTLKTQNQEGTLQKKKTQEGVPKSEYLAPSLFASIVSNLHVVLEIDIDGHTLPATHPPLTLHPHPTSSSPFLLFAAPYISITSSIKGWKIETMKKNVRWEEGRYFWGKF